MKGIFKVILTILFIFSSSPLWADEPAYPEVYVVAAPEGKYYFKMIPNEDYMDLYNSRGILYKVSPKEEDEIVWRTSGWYANSVYISANGMYLVRMGNWAGGEKPSDDDLAIAFYKNGKLIKSYSTKDLIKNVSAVVTTESHYFFLKDVKGFKGAYSNTFTIITIDNIEYEFDVSNGNIVSKKQLDAYSGGYYR